jgi:VIT1/CCC1 family predicted Fe2+/Mn2+ transporter
MHPSPATLQQLLTFQRDELTEHLIYKKLAATTRSPNNRAVLLRIAEDERRHHDLLQAATGCTVAPNRFKLWRYVGLARVLGLTFGVKLMESGEAGAQKNYRSVQADFAPAGLLAEEEDDHEQALIGLLDEERLRYTGSVVLGLNDALVELTGALAGFTLALQNTRLIALTGAITGMAAAFSMAASEYLSTRTEHSGKHPVKASVYTGTAYLFTVLTLIAPYLFLSNCYASLIVTLALGLLIIAAFNYYIAIATGAAFRRRFLEMAGLSLGVATVSFLVGFLLRRFAHIEI